MNFNFIHNKNFIKIAIGLIIVIVVVSIGFDFGSLTEGFNTYGKQPSKIPCPDYSDCKKCTSYYWPTVDGPMMCEWDPKGKRCQTGELNSSQPDPGWILNCDDSPTPSPTPNPSTTCPSKNNRFGCLLEDGCVWDNGKCRIDNQPGFDKCAGNDHCIPCTMSGCYFSKMGGCSKTKIDASYSRMCKDIVAPSQEKCQIHNNCKMCVQDGCLWGGTAGYTPNCISPDTEHSEADYSNKYCALRDESTSTTDTSTTTETQ